jgi:hypothetical protein
MSAPAPAEWTAEDLITILDRYHIPMTGRRLTDWSERGLLPPRQRGPGTGREPRYFWSEPDIVDRVVILSRLMKRYGRVDHIYVPFWLMGYDLEEPARSACYRRARRPIRQALTHWTAGAADGEAVLDRVSAFASRLTWSRRARPRPGMSHTEAADVVGEFVATFVHPSHLPPDHILAEMTTQAPLENGSPHHYLAASVAARPAHAADHTTAEDAEVPTLGVADEVRTHRELVGWVKRFATLPKLRRALKEADAALLEEGRADLVLLQEAIGAVLAVMFQANPQLNQLSRLAFPLRVGLLATFGPYLLAFDLSLRRAGYGQTIRRALRYVRRKARSAAHDPAALNEVRAHMGKQTDTIESRRHL